MFFSKPNLNKSFSNRWSVCKFSQNKTCRDFWLAKQGAAIVNSSRPSAPCPDEAGICNRRLPFLGLSLQKQLWKTSPVFSLRLLYINPEALLLCISAFESGHCCVFSVSMSVCLHGSLYTMCVEQPELEEASDPLDSEFKAIVSRCVTSQTWIQILLKSNNCS